MPGISFIYSPKHDFDKNRRLILSSLESLLHSSLYHSDVLIDGSSYLLACTRYKSYPIFSYETDQFHVCLEGQIYGKTESELMRELDNVALLIFKDPLAADGLLRQWLFKTNGEFIIFFLNKTSNEVAILTDALGHLPLYHCTNDGLLVLSRELRFITKIVGHIKLDKAALAQYLLFSYPLRNKSLFENIFRLEPGSILRINLPAGKANIKQLIELNFENKLNANRTLRQNAQQLIEILTEESRSVTKSTPTSVNVLGLSGGLDSRVVMLAMRNASVPFVAATRLGRLGMADSDVRVAGELAELFHLNWKCLELESPRFGDALALLRSKNGLNHLGMSFIVPFLVSLQQMYGEDAVYWTGDTGLALRSELPSEGIRNYEQLLSAILRDHQIFSIEDVATLLSTDPEAIRTEIKGILESFPEESLQQKYVHFVIYGRTVKWHYEGMDRNRCYLWTCAPLEFTPFVNYAMNCPDAQKTTYKLYRAILERMSPESSRITYAQHGLAPSSCLFPMVRKVRSSLHKMHPRINSVLRTLTRNTRAKIPINHLITKCIKQQMDSCSILRDYLSSKYVERILEKSTPLQGKVLLTVTSIVEDLTSSKSSLENYHESIFD